jgi:tetrahydromethanopterin S-methyltransferase subunit G
MDSKEIKEIKEKLQDYKEKIDSIEHHLSKLLGDQDRILKIENELKFKGSI